MQVGTRDAPVAAQPLIICRTIQTRISSGVHSVRIGRPHPDVESVKPDSYAGNDLKRSVRRLIEKRKRSRNFLEIRRQRIQTRSESAGNDSSGVYIKRPVEIPDRDEPQIVVAAWNIKKQFRFFGEALRQSGILILSSTLVIWGLVFIIGLQCGIEGAYFNRAVGAPAYAGVFAAWCDLRAPNAKTK